MRQWFADVGVLLCRGNRLLTGSSTHWLRLWEVKAFCPVQPQEKVSSSEIRSVAQGRFLLLLLYLVYTQSLEICVCCLCGRILFLSVVKV